MNRLPRRHRRRYVLGSIVLACLSSAWALADVVSHKRSIGFSLEPFDLYALRWTDGQLQFFHGVHLTPRYDLPASESNAAATVPTITRVAWDAPEPVGSPLGSIVRVDAADFRLVMRSWPPLADRATFLCGGQIAVPMPNGQGEDAPIVIECREVGWRYTVRAMAAWPAAAAFAIAAGWLCVRAYQASFLPGGCAACGYDLRASFDRCPECGAAIVSPASPR